MTNTCDECKHFKPDGFYTDAGVCELMVDSNDLHGNGRTLGAEPDKVYGWDHECYIAGVHVGPKFGCIHWAAREKGGAA